MSLDTTAAAHNYSARGWRVIPLHRIGPDGVTCSCMKGGNCTSKGKHPKDMKWQENPRLSAADIQATWDVSKPPNIGVATGTESGFWVLDIDPEHGGMDTMQALVAEHGALPATFVVKTGSGGYHYYFALPDFELRNTSNRVGPGIDTRANGGQVVTAPSVSDKGPYSVIIDHDLAQAPDWLLALARKDENLTAEVVTAKDLPKPEDLDEATWKRLTAYAQRAIDSELARLDALQAAGWSTPWNHTTFEVSCSLIEFANSPWNAYSLDQARNDVLTHTPRDNDGFDNYVVAKTFESARERVGDKARPMPEDRRQEPPEQDPLFGGPDVRNPTEGGGAPANPVVRIGSTARFFGGEKGTTPLYAEMADGVMELGPIGWGRDLDFWSYDGGVWTPDHYVVQHRLVDLLGNAYKTTHRSNTSDVVQRYAQPIGGDPLEAVMNFRNGMYDWRADILEDHDPSYGSTVQLGCEWIPDAECPQFEAFLGEVMHPDYVALAWEMIGYLMLSGNPRHVAFLFYGAGGNGKSTLMDVIEHLLGQQNIASESLDDLNGNRFRTASLFGKIANLAGDIDATYQENTATFKRITGEDEITAEHKNMPPFKFINWAVPVFSANKFPGSADVTEGYLRRWIVLHFHKKISAKDMVDRQVLRERFNAELPGIARKGVEALRGLMARGHFDPQGEATRAKEEFAMAIDHVRQWLAVGNVQGGPGIETSLTALYNAYHDWAVRSGTKNPVRQQEFSHRLEAVGYPSTKIAGEIYHAGISVPLVAVTSPQNFF